MIFANISLIKIYFISLLATSLVLLFSIIFFKVLAKLIGKYDNSKIPSSQTRREVCFLILNSVVLNFSTLIWIFLSDKLMHPIIYQASFFHVLATVVGLLLSIEFFYYVMHRWYHSNKLMKYHVDHHKSITCQPTTGQSVGVVETLTIDLLPFPFVLIMSCFFSLPFYGLCLWALTYYFSSIWLHSNIKFSDKTEKALRKIGLITPSLHADHHIKYAGNYGLYLIFFDKLFGTEIK